MIQSSVAGRLFCFLNQYRCSDDKHCYCCLFIVITLILVRLSNHIYISIHYINIMILYSTVAYSLVLIRLPDIYYCRDVLVTELGQPLLDDLIIFLPQTGKSTNCFLIKALLLYHSSLTYLSPFFNFPQLDCVSSSNTFVLVFSTHQIIFC